MKNNHKYRVNVYLGKETYGKLEVISEMLKMPISTVARILLNTGIEMGEAMNHIDNIVPFTEEVSSNGGK